MPLEYLVVGNNVWGRGATPKVAMKNAKEQGPHEVKPGSFAWMTYLIDTRATLETHNNPPDIFSPEDGFQTVMIMLHDDKGNEMPMSDGDIMVASQ